LEYWLFEPSSIQRFITILHLESSRVDPHPAIAEVFTLVERDVWIVTAAAGKLRGGLVATWVSQSSIDPKSPTVAVSIAVNHFTRELIDAAGCFSLHLITAAQIDLAWRMCLTSGRNQDKLAGLAVRQGETGGPILEDCLAWLECRVFHRFLGGDRVYYWADVVSGGRMGEGRPLTDRQLFEAADDKQWAVLRQGTLGDIAVQRPLYKAWRAKGNSTE
jgi:flavin reductase (DIM6/NTAB) family NADH-FMN oxidoreductase RutF